MSAAGGGTLCDCSAAARVCAALAVLDAAPVVAGRAGADGADAAGTRVAGAAVAAAGFSLGGGFGRVQAAQRDVAAVVVHLHLHRDGRRVDTAAVALMVAAGAAVARCAKGFCGYAGGGGVAKMVAAVVVAACGCIGFGAGGVVDGRGWNRGRRG